MRILFIIDSLKRGGKERQFYELVRHISTAYETYVITFSREIEFPDISKYSKELIVLPKLRLPNFRVVFTLWRYIRTINPHLIHTWDHLSTIACIIPKLRHKIPLVNGSIRYAFQLNRLSKLDILAKLGFLFSDVIVANSMAGLKTHNLGKNKKHVVIYNGFDFRRLTNPHNSLTFDLNIVRSNFKLCMVANFLPSKDHMTLIKACNELTNEYNSVSIILIGDGPLRNSIEANIPDNKKHHYIFTGLIHDVESILKVCDIGILLCNTMGHAEGISNSIMEYMASGLPVIATKAGGTVEIVTEGQNGFLVKPFDIDMVKDRIVYLLTHEKERKILGEQSRKNIVDNFSIVKMIEKYTHLYKEISA